MVSLVCTALVAGNIDVQPNPVWGEFELVFLPLVCLCRSTSVVTGGHVSHLIATSNSFRKLHMAAMWLKAQAVYEAVAVKMIAQRARSYPDIAAGVVLLSPANEGLRKDVAITPGTQHHTSQPTTPQHLLQKQVTGRRWSKS